MTRRLPALDRRALFSNAAAAALLAATGVSASEAPQRGGRLRMALSGALRSDDWRTGSGLFMQVARQGLVFDTLTEVAADGTLQGELAISWQADSAARVWTFDLRQNVSFHDGTPLSTRDVTASLAGLLDGDITALNQRQLRITLAVPMPSLPLVLSQPEFVIRPAHALHDGVGTGLYAVKSFVPGQRMLTTRVAQHYKDGRAGWFDEVELTSITSEQVRGQALRETLVDAADINTPAVLHDVRDVVALPDRRRMTYAVLTDVAQPAQISHQRPLDNLRAAERWWFRTG